MVDTLSRGTRFRKFRIYLVIHDAAHSMTHEGACVHGKRFPPCRGCNDPRFELVRAARHIDMYEHLK
jgi:hypothetical protein